MADGDEPRRTITKLRVVTIRTRGASVTSYRIEMKLVDARVLPAPYVHNR